ncbi:MAG TPA: amidohydrolase [Vicinamibacteria bacterium]|nr:amidohydrolase [Vicinamibacteria bacterium]
MDPSFPLAEAFAVRDGRIVEVGGSDEILWLREAASELIDLQGRTVTPGFVDPHNHLSIGALECFWADCRPARSIADVQRALAEAAARTPAGAWVRGVGYHQDRLAERRHPTRGELDEAVPDRPVLLMHFSHHQAVAGSRALAAAGLTRATPDPAGGEIARDRAGEPTGLLFERALEPAETLSRAGWETRFVEVVGAATRAYARLGITAIHDVAVTPAMARRYAEARAAGALAIRVETAMVGSGGWFAPPDDAAPGTLKLFVDGGYRCAMRVTRDGQPRTSGFLFYGADELAARLVAAWGEGRRVVCHAIGNLGLETAADALAAALARDPSGRARVRVDHAIFPTREQVTRLADLGVAVVGQPSFLHDLGGRAPAPDILLRPFGSLAAAGVAQAFSSDFPCGSLAPLTGIHAAVTRRDRDGEVHDPAEALSVEAAFEAYTIGAARAMGFEREGGSLERGKRADFLVFSTDPLTAEPDRWLALAPGETWVEGVNIADRP